MRNSSLGRAALLTAVGVGLSASLLGAEVSGFVKREIFRAPGTGEPNANPPTFSNPNYPDSPDAITYLDTWAAPQSANPNVEDYLTKISGWIHPDHDDDYVFFFSSDDHGAFYLSTDDSPTNLKLIAQETNWSNPLQWQSSGGTSDLTAKRSDTFTGSTWPAPAATIHLLKTKKYYAVAFGKEGGGGDNTGVTMIPKSQVVNADPNDPNVTPVPADGDSSTLTGALISCDAPTALAIAKQPQSITVLQGRPAVFKVQGAVIPGTPTQDPTLVVPDIAYQWQRNDADIPLVDNDGDGIADDGSNTATYTLDPANTADNGAKFRCKLTFGGATTLTSDEAILTVSTDNIPPTFVATGGDNNPPDALTTVTLTFNEKMDTATLGAATYKVSGGITVSAANVVSPTVVVLTTSKQAENTPYTATVTGAKDIAGNALTPTTADFSSLAFKTGLVNWQRWDAVSDDVDAFIQNSYGTLAPTDSGVLSQFYYPQTSPNLDNFVSHLAGYFLPPTTGDYVFFFSSDDHGVLFLSTDDNPANKQEIARETQWSNAGNWATSDNGGADLDSKRSDKNTTSTWPTGATISLTKGKRYYIESFAKEGGGGDDNTATFKLASDADPANGSTALKGDAVGTFADLSTLPPVITARPAGKHFNRGDTLTFTVTVDSPKPVTYQWYRTKKAIAGATSATLTIPNAGPESIGDYYVVATSVNGTASSYPDDDVRAIMNGAFVVEMEDFNYGGGKSVPAASVMPLGPSLYYGLDGLPGIDFHLANQSTTDPTANGNVYRNGYKDTNGVTVDFPTAPEALGNVDVLDDAGNSDRGDITIAQNHKIGWGDTGEWYQYTRDFPPGDYNVVLGAGLDGRAVDALGAQLQIVTGDITKTGAATTTVASLLSDGTGAWSSDDYITFKDPNDATKLAKVTLGANTTVRAVMSVGGYDFDFLMFYKIPGGGGETMITTGPVAGLPSGGAPLTGVVNDTASKTITANMPANPDTAAYLTITPPVTVTSVSVVNGKLVIKYQ